MGERLSVIICTHTDRRWDQLERAISALDEQTRPPDEIIIVVDHNAELLARASNTWTDRHIVPNGGKKGLSDARNTGIGATSGSILIFLDDDAAADPECLERMERVFEDAAVQAVGGSANPMWETGRPSWFPREFDWVVGCSYRGLPEQLEQVRNLIGCVMAFRRESFESVGGFSTSLGRTADRPSGCEETELCIRIGQSFGTGSVIYEPAAVVDHDVPTSRSTLRYFIQRCYAEGGSKALVASISGKTAALSVERAYATHTLPAGMLRGVADLLRGRPAGILRVAAIIVGLAVTSVGYATGTLGVAFSKRSTT